MKEEAFYRWIAFLHKIRFGWLVPFFLLIKGEDPKTQFKSIFSGVLMPVFSILIFLWIWDLASKEIVTKFGTVPGPKQVWSAWKALGGGPALKDGTAEGFRTRFVRSPFFDDGVVMDRAFEMNSRTNSEATVWDVAMPNTLD